MELIKVKGPTIKWVDIEARDEELRLWMIAPWGSAQHAAAQARIKDLKPNIDRLLALDKEIQATLGVLYEDGRVKSKPGPQEHILIVGAIDFSDSSHPEQRGIWSARRVASFGYEQHAEELYITVMLRPGGPGGQDGEIKKWRPSEGLRMLGMQFLGETPFDASD